MECPSCGATVEWDPAGQQLACSKCATVLPVAAPAGPVPVRAYVSISAGLTASTDDHEAAHHDCDGCGASEDLASDTWAGRCRYCRQPFVGNPASTRDLRPDGVLPLAITQDQARVAVSAWLGSRWFAPRALRSAALGQLEPTYSPTWVFDLSCDARYEGRRGDDYQVPESRTTTNADGSSTTETVMVTHTRWRNVSGAVHEDFADLVAPGRRDPVAREAGDTGGWDLQAAVPYADDYLRGASAQTYERNVVAGFDDAAAQTTDRIEELVRDDIGGDHQDIRELEPRFGGVEVRHLFVPAWLAAYTFAGRPYDIVVNGRTGKVAGTRPVSRAKVAAVVVAVLVVVALVAFVLSRRSSAPPPAPAPTTVAPSTVAPSTVAPTSSTTPSTTVTTSTVASAPPTSAG